MGSLEVLTLQDREKWNSVLAGIPNANVSATPDYCRVFEDNDDGQAICLNYEHDLGHVSYPFFKRSLNDLPFDHSLKKDAFDTSTPFGYGGIHMDCDLSNREKLAFSFRSAMTEYANDTGIISEFIRFDPMVQNHIPFKKHLDQVRHHSNNLIIDLKKTEHRLLADCRERIRTGIRQTARLGLEIESLQTPDVVRQFTHLYETAMKRRGNLGYLNFKPQFFNALLSNLEDKAQLFLVREHETVLAAAIVLKNGSTLDYFLAANLRSPDRPYVNHFLIYETAKWAKAEGFERFHLGGGTESIMYFKSSFTKETIPYFVGNHIFDHTAYAALVQSGQRSGHIPAIIPPFFFPAYRAFLSENSDRALLDALNSPQSV
tara:strand:+ start:46063 stop:47184 length:1122 start_codon:yes stop_codon:yes gene_type:complete